MKHDFALRGLGIRWLPLAAALAVSLAAVMIWRALVAREMRQIHQLVTSESIDVQDRLKSHVQGQVDALVRMARRTEQLWSTLGSQQERMIADLWSGDAKFYVQHHDGYEGIAWLGAEGDVRFIEPQAARRVLVSAKLAEQLPVRQAIDAARQTRRVKISRPLKFSTFDTGFVICAPIFSANEYMGCLAGIFDARRLLDTVLRDNLARGYEVSITDAVRETPRTIYSNDRGPSDAPNFTKRADIDFGGVAWTIRVWPTAPLLAKQRTSLPEVILGAGILVACLLAAALYEFQKTRAWAGQIAQAHEQLRQIEERHRLTLENCMDAFIGIDQAGAVREWNRQAEHIFGWSRDEVLGRLLRDLVIPVELREAHQRGLEHFLKTREGPLLNRRVEVEALHKDGRRFPIELNITPVKADGWQMFTAFVRDITERKQAERDLRSLNETLEQRIAERTTELRSTLHELTQAKEAAEAASQAKSSFLANMSHEIRTPLNAVIGMTELVLDTPLNAEQRDYLRAVHESGEALLTLINDILDFSKIEAGRLDLQHVAFDHADVLGDAFKLLGLRAAGKGLELVCRIAPDVPTILTGDEGRLRQVLMNLVGNAIKFTERGEVALDVRLDSSSVGAVVLHYAVRDTGIGVPADKLEKIFEPFEQADFSTTRRFGGTGLGLSISSRLVELLGGRIWAEGEPGRGSTFHFTARFAVPGEQPLTIPSVDFDAIRDLPVLVVDDNATNRKLLHELLAAWGMSPTEAESAAQAMVAMRMALRRGRPFRLLLADVQMPDVDGFELVRRIKRDPDLSGTTVIMLSSGERPGNWAACEELGVAAHLMKPIMRSELLGAILRTLGTTSPKRAEEVSASGSLPSVRPLHVLLAEDSPVNQKLAVALLTKGGHVVEVADNGREAIDSWKRGGHDLVLMDVQMPELDGLEATKTIRANEQQRGGHTPIIAMTAHALKGDRQRCLEAGMDDYVAKPVRRRELFDAISRVLGESEAVPAEVEHFDDDLSETPAAGVVNWRAALKTAHGDRQLLQELVEISVQETADLLGEMQLAVEQEDAARLHRAAHSLKGQCRIFGAAVPEHLALHIETAARDGGTDSAPLIVKLRRHIEQMQVEQRDFLAGRTSLDHAAVPSG